MQCRLSVDEDVQVGLFALAENGPKTLKVVVIDDGDQLLHQRQLRRP